MKKKISSYSSILTLTPKIHLSRSPTHYLILCLLFFILPNCTNIERVDTAQVKELVNNGEIKRITAVQIETTTNRLGKLLLDSLNTIFLSQKTLNCSIDENELVKNLNKEYGIKVRLLGLRDSTSKALYSKELEVIQAYAYNAEKGLPIESNIQKMGDSLLIYTAQATNKLQFAKQCLGDANNALAVWSLVFPKAQVIKRIE